MPVTVSMPQLGETVTEGTILSWHKQPGDEIAEDEVLLEISTDKVDTEVPSPAAGIVKEILVPEGETVEVGAALAVIASPGEDAGEAAAPAEEPAEEPEPEPEPDAAAEEEEQQPEPEAAPEPAAAPAAASAEPAAPVKAPDGDGMRQVLSPVVRKLASEHDLDLSQVEGTGRDGRITRQDVMAMVESGGAAAAATTTKEAPPPVKAPPTTEKQAPPAPKAQPASKPAAAAGDIPTMPGDEVVQIDRLRTRIAQNMVRSKATAAHVWTSVEVDYEAVEQVRQRHKAAWKEREGFSLTYLPFISRATIDALAEFPVVNSSFYLEQGKSVLHRTVNLGIAVDLDQQGLVVLPIKGADGLRLVGLAREIRRLADKARSGKLEPDDLSGATFTVTNPGPFGSFMSAPIINVPNTGILSTDTVEKRPTVVSDGSGGDALAIHHIGYLGLTWDHRAFDGSTAVLFLRRIKENLETWDWEQELA